MAYNPFKRRDPRDAGSSDFAATVASLPAGVEDAPSLPPAPDSVPSPVEISKPGGAASDFGGDSLPAAVEAELEVEQSPTLSHIGRYAIKGPLGQGGLGQIYEAWDPLLSRTVAVKTLHFDVDTPSRVSLDELILNEARAAASLNHPHIVTVHDAGLSPQGVYIAMERLRGRDLRHALADGWRPTPGEAALLMRRVADALAYAHGRGVVHCDIKPANIFVTRRDKPKVLDFGIARVAHSAAVPALEGLIAGSPHYLAPEQLQGGKVDARTDIHALGVVFYELLTGRKAFYGDTLEQITNAVLTNHPAPANEVRPGVPPTLALIAATAMARKPDERYANAGIMAAELRRWIDRHTTAVSRHASSARQSTKATATATTHAVQPAARPAAARDRSLRWLLIAAVVLAVAAVAAWALRSRAPAAALSSPLATQPVAPPPAATPEPAATLAAPAVEAVPPNAFPNALPDAASAPPAAAAVLAPAPVTAPVQGAAARPGTRPKAQPGQVARAAAPITAAQVVTGSLQFAISPWGQVEVDGTPAGTTPPLARLTLPEGSHSITVRNADFPPLTVTVQVSADKPATVRHRFGP